MPAVDSSPMPTRMAVRNLIGDLIGRDIEIRDSDPMPSKVTNVTGVYVTDRLATSAIAVLDFEGAARLGGALGMLPRGGVEDAIGERNLPPVIRDCTYEVLNVLASAFNVGNAPHVRLYQMYGPGGGVPTDVASMGAAAIGRMDVTLQISGYGNGRLSIVVR
jgi:hypothetical protein